MPARMPDRRSGVNRPKVESTSGGRQMCCAYRSGGRIIPGIGSEMTVKVKMRYKTTVHRKTLIVS